MRIVNWDIIKHPMNWFTVLLMVIFAGMVFTFIMDHWANNTNNSAS